MSESPPLPPVNSLWRAPNGKVFRVVAVTSKDQEGPKPTLVVYENVRGNTLMARRVEQWRHKLRPYTPRAKSTEP